MNSVRNHYLKPHTQNSSFYFMEPSKKTTTTITEKNQTGSSSASLNENKKIEEVWSQHNFDKNTKVKVEDLLIFNNVKTTWGGNFACAEDSTSIDKSQTIVNNSNNNNNNSIEEEEKPSKEKRKGLIIMDVEVDEDATNPNMEEVVSPSHHARRPPNAFLIFCKKHRPIVRQRYPTTENRGVTKILGEWWALLGTTEKQPYNDLAKEYKDAFLTANPGFRWYKLPAPPLRTLTTRPTTILKSPQTHSITTTTTTVSSSSVTSSPSIILSEFTPGKLADESQLGGLTSLMNNNYNNSLKKLEDDSPPCCNNNNQEDNNNIQEIYSTTATAHSDAKESSIVKKRSPPKPIKKRFFEQYEDEEKKTFIEDVDNSITQQELLNKVVDGIFANEKEGNKEQRKSDRVCKGKRYERFMVEGKLLGNKRETKLTQHHKFSRIESKIEQELTLVKNSNEQQHQNSFNLENTIKRLAERTNIKIEPEEDSIKPKIERVRTVSETSEGNLNKSPQISFNLDQRIENLPCLSYEDFVCRKRESKKRKLKIKSSSESILNNNNNKIQRVENNNKIDTTPVVGSKKRKNKLSITHLNKTDEENAKISADSSPNNALLGLATLAMVAASTEKIEENC